MRDETKKKNYVGTEKGVVTDPQAKIKTGPKLSLHKPDKYQIQLEQEAWKFQKSISKKEMEAN